MPKEVNFVIQGIIVLLKFKQGIAIVGALAFAFSSYNIIIIAAGHITKCYAIAYMAPVLAGIIHCYNKNYVLGFFLTAFALGIEIACNHPQILYYLAILCGVFFVWKAIEAFRTKKDEANPDNPLLTNCSRAGQAMQIQGTGHGDFVEAADGSWWVVFLAYRNFGGSYHHLGRETCLAPVEWPEGEWPVVNGGNAIDTLMQVKTLAPQLPRNTQKGRHDLVYMQNPIAQNYVPAGKGWRLTAHSSLTENQQPTFLGYRQESPHIVMETEIDTDQLDFGCKAGLTVYQIHDGHMDVAIEKYMTGTTAVMMNYQIKSLKGEVMGEDSGRLGKVRLRITSDGNNYYFLYSNDGGEWKLLASHAVSLLSTEVVGGFTGVTVGMFAEGEGSATFNYFDYSEK